MGQLPKLVNFSSKLALQILPSVSATVIGGYLLAQMHAGHNPEPPVQQIVVTPPPAPVAEAPTVREERAAMRKVLKERRENPQPPALVKPIPPTEPAAGASATAPAATASVTPSGAPPAAVDSSSPVERARAKPAVAVAAPPRREVERHAETEASTDYVPAPPPGLPSRASAMNAPTPIVPPQVPPPVGATQQVMAPPLAPAPQSAPLVAPSGPGAPAFASAVPPPVPPPPAEPPPRGPVTAVFSTLSSIVGHAANATGTTVNWVIDLPGKAISAGGRVINGSQPPPAPAHFGDGEG